MPRSIWRGAISFGLVNVPVKLYSAVSKKTVRFNQLHAEDGFRIQQKRVCSKDGEEVPYEDIVKGYEISPDRYVMITSEELEALDPKKTRTIDIEDFVDLEEIDPLYYEHPYYLAPDTGASKAYKLLLTALEETNKVAIARVVIRSKEYLTAIRPANGLLTLETMLFADELVSPDTIEELPEEDVRATKREVEMARQLIASLATDFDPSKYRDEYRERVLDLIERKAEGEEISIQPLPEQPTKVPDLMAALEASLAEAKGRPAADGKATAAKNGKAAPARKRATTRKSTAAKPRSAKSSAAKLSAAKSSNSKRSSKSGSGRSKQKAKA
jgi:DNA end-binding protein Ku